MAPKDKKGGKKTRSTLADVVTRDYTIHLHKAVHGKGFKHRAPTATKAVVAFAQKAMGTKDVRVHPSLNTAIWQRGVRNVPRRLRVRLARQRNQDADAKEKLFTMAEPVEVTSYKGLGTETVENENE